MRIIKNINNNVSLCQDSQGREMIAFGKGIGFMKPPCEVPLEKIQRTFYNIPENYIHVMEVIPEDILELATEIYDYARERLQHTPSSVIFTLADHIQFAIKREIEHISIQLPMLYEIKNLYPEETEIGKYAVKLINRKFQLHLPREEAASIALHFIGGKVTAVQQANRDEKDIVDQCTGIIEETMKIQIDKNGFNYSRFLTHLHYLLERVKKNESLNTENEKMYEELKRQYPKAYECALKIEKYLKVQLKNEEILYLILHINRLCSREEKE